MSSNGAPAVPSLQSYGNRSRDAPCRQWPLHAWSEESAPGDLERSVSIKPWLFDHQLEIQ